MLYSTFLKSITGLVFTLLIITATQANYTEGKEYILLDENSRFTVSQENEVVEFFFFGCPHCNNLHPKIKQWLKQKPSSVDFHYIPALFSKNWEWSATLFAVMYSLDKVDVMIDDVYKKVHEGGGIRSRKDIYDLFAKVGVDEERVNKAYSSFVVSNLREKYRNLTLKSQINGVPALIVKGKYLVNSATAGANMLDVVNYLLRKK